MKALLQIYPGDAAAATIGSVCVQIAVIACVAWAAARLLGRRQPAARHDVWLFALLAILATPIVTVALGRAGISWGLLPSLPEIVASSDAAAPPTGEASPLPRIDDVDGRGAGLAANVAGPLDRMQDVSGRVPPTDPLSPAATEHGDGLRALFGAALLVWLTGAVFLLSRLVRGVGIAKALRREAKPARDPSTHRLVREIAEALGLDRSARFATHDGIVGPVTVGIFRPIVLVPTRLFAAMGEERKRDVLRHEFAHIARHDPLVGLLQRFARTLFWPHPFVALVHHGLSRAREEVCDNYALQSGDRSGYSRFLLELSTKVPEAVPGYHGLYLLPLRWRLSDRVAGILDERRSVMTRTKKWKAALVAAAFVTLTLGIGAATAVPALSAGDDEKAAKVKAERSELQKMKENLKGLDRGMAALRELGATEELERLERIAAVLRAHVEAAQHEESAEKLRQEKHHIASMAKAAQVLSEAGHADEAKRLEHAVLARRVALEQRDDDEAKAIRKEAPKRKEQAALLAKAAECLRASGNEDRAGEVAALAASMEPRGGKENGPKKAVSGDGSEAGPKRQHEKPLRDPEPKQEKDDDRAATVERIRQLEKKLAGLLEGVDKIERELRELKSRLD